MQSKFKKLVCVVFIMFVFSGCVSKADTQRHTQAFYAMNTVINQQAYGKNAQSAMLATEKSLIAFENELSLFIAESDIMQINANAGNPVKVKQQTLDLIEQSKLLSLQSENAFAITIAPLSKAWGITSETPRVLTQAEIDELLPLVNDNDIIINKTNSTVMLKNKGQSIDLGGIAKGTACNVAKQIYEEHNVKSALLSIGGNIYAKGTKPDGNAFRIGFRDPKGNESSYIASFTMQDAVFAVSGGYERYFEENGNRYIHILDPKTGAPAQSDIVSVGVMHEDGTQADFWSTTLFVWGKDKTIQYMKNGGTVIMLTEDNTLYVSSSLKDSFKISEGFENQYNIVYIEKEQLNAQ